VNSPDSDPRTTVPYIPVDCGFHDRLEDFAVRRVPVSIHLSPLGSQTRGEEAVHGLIADVFACDGADWMVLQTASEALTVRLDRIRSVNGIPLPSNPTCRTDNHGNRI
jgi:transcriptional antiterminator Rof (Rho-off)